MTTKRIIKPNDAIIRGGFTELKQIIGDSLREQIPVLVGNPDTGDIYVDSNTQSEIYVHDDGSTISGVSIISASGIDSQYIKYNQPILVKLTASGVYQFAGIDSQSDATYSAGSGDINTQQPVHLNQLDYGTIHPYSGLQVLVKGAKYADTYVDDIITDVFDGTAEDTSMVSITPPTTNNRQIAVLIQMDASTPSLEYKQSAEYSAAINRVNAYNSGKIPTKDADRFFVGVVFLKTGMSTITYDDIWCLPEFITSAGASGATTELDNLTTTAINAHLLPASNSTYDLASTAGYWRASYIDTMYLSEQSEPSTPASTKGVLYITSGSLLHFKNDAGQVYDLTGGVEFGEANMGDIGASSTTSTSGVDVTNASFSATIGNNGDINVVFYNLRVGAPSGQFCELRIVAGAVNGTWHPVVGNNVTQNPVTFAGSLSGVSSGSQTVKLQFRSSGGGTVTIDTNQLIANDVYAVWVSK